MKRVLVVATSRKTRGGITSVVKAHEKGVQWNEYHCKWLETHRDGPFIIKIGYLLKAIIAFIVLLPFYDIVHIHFSEYSSARRKLFFASMAKIMNKKIILHFHAPNPNNTYKQYPSLYRKMFLMADYVIVLSENWKSDLLLHIPLDERKVKVIFNPCPEVQLQNLNKKNYILYAGTLNQRKGYYDLIDAFSKIASKHKDWMVVFAGNGEIEQAKQLAIKVGISDQVIFRGWISGSDKDTLFNESSIFCLPSYAEGFPMAVLDAWAYGLPVITTPVGGIPEIVVNGKNGMIFKPGDIDNLVSILEELITNEDLRQQLSKASLQMSKTQFNITTINQQIGEIYRKCLAE